MVNKLLNGNFTNHMLPFFWQHGEDEKTLREYVDAIEKSGCRELCVESRPHPDFCGEKWWQDMDVIMDECRKRNMGVWVLDDAHFPTGYASGKADGSPYRRLFLVESHIDVPGPQKGVSLIIQPDNPQGSYENSPFADFEGVKAVIAMKRIPGRDVDHSTFVNINMSPVDGDTAIDLTEGLTDGVVYWDVPDGLWRVFTITAVHDVRGLTTRPYINPLTKEGTKILIDAVYEPHFERYGKDFGNTFKGFFSDEPTLGSAHSYHSIIGKHPQLPIPWFDGFMELMGGDRCDLPAFWYDIGDKTASIRYKYMDNVSKLYGENFTMELGNWCRAHDVEYMGHVIEENNNHARLGHGTGHYFRALWGQDFAGIDIVLHEIIPGIKGQSHAWTSTPYEADNEFFFYMLAQMAASLSHIDPKKKGRAMCEIFGAFGWQEGLTEMKWQADFMMSRGINSFVPHAFTPKAFPDPDCPPHFYAHGKNPQYRYFKILMDYMNRVSDLISGGTHLAKAGVIYYAEAEWAGKCMKTQVPMRLLTQNQIEPDVLPIDEILKADIEDGRFMINGESYELLVIPYAQLLPKKTVDMCRKLRAGGVPVLFVNDLPEGFSDSKDDIGGILNELGCEVVPEALLYKKARQIVGDDCLCSGFEPDLKLYPYKIGNAKHYLMFNEGIFDKIFCTMAFDESRVPFWYDPMENKAYPAKYTVKNAQYIVDVELEPYELKFLVFADDIPELSQKPCAAKRTDISDGFGVKIATAEEFPNFTVSPVQGVGNLNKKDALPRFSGTVRYEKSIELDPVKKTVLIDAGEAYETLHVFVNGVDCGAKIAPPYVFDISGAVKAGKNDIRIDVTNTLVYRQHDMLSKFQAMPPSGIIGPVEIVTE